MARIRTIKPEFWSDGKNVGLSPLARLLFIGSWNFAMCDDGHLPDDPTGLKLKVLPADDVDPTELLDELLFSGQMIRGTTADGRSYLHIHRLRDHQKVDGRWTPRCFVCAQNPAKTQPNSPNPAQTRASLGETRGDSPQEGKGKERKGTEKTSSSPPRKRGSRIPDDFKPSDDVAAWTISQGFTPGQAETLVAEFIDYWSAKAGQGATKTDWDATFRNWVRKADPSRVRETTSQPAAVQRLSAEQINNVLGPDHWTPPSPPPGLDPDERWEWERRQRVEHIEERQQQARARLGRTA